MEDEKAMEIVKPMMGQITEHLVPDNDDGAVTTEMGNAMIRYMPIRNLACFGGVKKEEITKLLEAINQQ